MSIFRWSAPIGLERIVGISDDKVDKVMDKEETAQGEEITIAYFNPV
jgi:hypothetical protein